MALTANAMKGDEKPILEAGFSHYQTKPIDLDKLGSLLAELMNGVAIQTARKEDSAIVADSVDEVVDTANKQTQTQPISAGSELVSTLAQRDPRFQSTVDDFVLRCNTRAADFTSALESRNYDELASLAHWLKGSGGTVGFAEFIEPSAALEMAAKSNNPELCQTHLQALKDLWQRLPGSTSSSKCANTITEVADQFTECPAEPSESGVLADTPVISELLDRDPRMAAIVDQFVDRLATQIEAMQKAIETENFNELADLAHWLKGSGGNVGFKDMGSLAAELERSAKANDPTGSKTAMSAVESYASRIERGRDPAFLNKSA